jgi:two-component system, HptB-dependent secretion and biofilm response regulator
VGFSNFRVLVVDDTQANRALLRAYLARLEFQILMAEDGEEALSMYQAERPDIVLMDLMMPKMDGFVAIQRIRAMDADKWVPIVIVSAMDAEYDVVRGLEAGADDYMTKPLSYQVFAAKMRNLARALEFQVSREEARQREAAVSDAVVDGIITFDAFFSVVGANRAAVGIFNCYDDGLPGVDVRSLLLDLPGAERWGDYFAGCLSGGDSPFVGSLSEVVGRRLDGSRFPCEMCISELPVLDRRLFIAVVRDISERKRVERQLAENAGHLQQYHDEAEAEAELAKDIMERHIRSDALEQPGIQHFVMPTHRFSGDIVLAARSRSGKLYAMLADATGHGLAAAMSGLAIVNDFYRAVEEEMPLRRMVLMLNNALTELLPQGRFVSAGLVLLDQRLQHGSLWLGGVPDVLCVSADNQVTGHFRADQLPLGIEMWQADDVMVHSLEWHEHSQLLLCSDGLIEAEGRAGVPFGYEGVELAITHADETNRLDLLCRALREHLGDLPGHDDISMLLLDLF